MPERLRLLLLLYVLALLGFDAKLSQYTRGKAFVDHVVGRYGWRGSTPSG